MPSALKELGKLTPKTQSFEASRGGGGADVIRWEDVAGALAGLDRGPYLLARVVFVGDQPATREAVDFLACVLARYFRRNGWSVAHARGLAELLLFEVVWPRVCQPCAGSGFVSRVAPREVEGVRVGRTVYEVCESCEGRGRFAPSHREAEQVSGVGRSQYTRVWCERVEPIRRMVMGWEGRLVRHVQRNLTLLDESA